ncbi:unnamed protein product [Boreogadus saida]
MLLFPPRIKKHVAAVAALESEREEKFRRFLAGLDPALKAKCLEMGATDLEEAYTWRRAIRMLTTAIRETAGSWCRGPNASYSYDFVDPDALQPGFAPWPQWRCLTTLRLQTGHKQSQFLCIHSVVVELNCEDDCEDQLWKKKKKTPASQEEGVSGSEQLVGRQQNHHGNG